MFVMKRLLIYILLLFVVSIGQAQERKIQKFKISTIEDFFRFENVDQLCSYFGKENIFTEKTFYQKPESGGKAYLVSQVNFGTPKAVLVIWSGDGKLLCGVQSSAYFFDYKAQKKRLMPNNWKTKQGLASGMKLSELVKVNWFAIKFKTHTGKANYGDLFPGFGWLKFKRSVSFLPEKLIYEYTLDLKKRNEYFPTLSSLTLNSNDKLVRKWNPMLEMISIYREGMKPIN